MLAVFFLLFIINTNNAQEKNLDYFVRLACHNSPLLRDYRTRLENNKIDSLRLRAALGPQVNASTNNSYAPVINGIGQDEAITNGTNIYAAVAVTKEIISRKNLQNQLASIGLQKQSILIPAGISEQELVKGVTDQYITAYGLQQQQVFCNSVLDLLRKEEGMFKQLTASGIYKQTDYLTFKIVLQQQEMQLSQISNQFRNAFRSLHYLCGVMDTTTSPLADPQLKQPKLPELQHSLFYQQFVTDSLNLRINAKQIELGYQPRLHLFGEVGYNSSLFDQPFRNFGPNVGMSLSIPIYDGHQRKLQLNQIRLSEQSRSAYREFFTKQYGQQISQLTLQLSDNQKLEGQILRQVAYAVALVAANRKLLETGEIGVPEYIIALSNLLITKNQLIQNEIEKYQIINQLNYWCREKQ